MVELSEYALARVEEALRHDLDGTIGDVSEEHVYQDLKAHADRAGTWERWREKALGLLREDIATKKEN